MLRPKKNSYKEFDNEKKFLRLKNSPPPHNFSNGLSLTTQKFSAFEEMDGIDDLHTSSHLPSITKACEVSLDASSTFDAAV